MPGTAGKPTIPTERQKIALRIAALFPSPSFSLKARKNLICDCKVEAKRARSGAPSREGLRLMMGGAGAGGPKKTTDEA